MDSLWTSIVIPILLVAGGIAWLYFSSKKKQRCSLPVAGTIVEVKREYSRDEDGTSVTYRPVYSYVVDGAEYRSEGSFSSNRKRTFKVGEVDELLVNPKQPREFLVGGREHNGVLGVGLILIGAFMFVAYNFLGMGPS